MAPSGRKPTGQPVKDNWITTRVTEAELDVLKCGAKMAGLTVSDFTRLTALNAAKALLSGQPDDVSRWAVTTSKVLVTTLEK